MHALYKLSILPNPSYLYSMHALHKASTLPNPNYEQYAFRTQDEYNTDIKQFLYLHVHIGVDEQDMILPVC
jgi:gamma-glutamyl:cysteine ligase YbdK (ATP-grasp superfamily)